MTFEIIFFHLAPPPYMLTMLCIFDLFCDNVPICVKFSSERYWKALKKMGQLSRRYKIWFEISLMHRLFITLQVYVVCRSIFISSLHVYQLDSIINAQRSDGDAAKYLLAILIASCSSTTSSFLIFSWISLSSIPVLAFTNAWT